MLIEFRAEAAEDELLDAGEAIDRLLARADDAEVDLCPRLTAFLLALEEAITGALRRDAA